MRSAWVIVLACALGLAFSPAALYFQTFGLFIKPIVAEFGWGRFQLSAAISIAALAAAVASPLIGRAIDYLGPRRVVLVATTTFSIAIASLWFVPRSMPVFIAITASLGLSAAGCGPVAYASVLSRWFDARLGTSLAFAITGLGLGQFLAPLYTNWLLQHFNWHLTYVMLGLIAFVVTVPNALTLLKDRRTINGSPAGQNEADKDGTSYRDALRMPVFWRLASTFLLITIATTGCMVHIVPLITDRGFSSSDAASAAALLGIAALMGRLMMGVLLDYLSASLLGALSFSGCALGILLIAIDLPGLPLKIGMILVGASLGAEGDLMPFVVRRVFGVRSYATIYGALFVAFTIGLVLGPLVMGFSFDHFGSYDAGLKAIGIFSVIAALLWLPALPVGGLRTQRDKHELNATR